MTAPIITAAKVLQGTNPTLVARVRDPADGTLFTQATVSAITYKTYDTADLTTEIATGTLDKATEISDTLQTGARWTADGTGYNFDWTIPTAKIPNAGVTYQVEITIDAAAEASGNVLLIFQLEIVNAASVADV